jgi:two-component system, chemotaxis family, chemotaxis protein CheY
MKKILIVDDELSVREMVADMLTNNDTEVLLAENGIQALQVLSSETIALVVTDIVMAEENGIDLIMDMKKAYPAIPVVAISGGGGIEGRFNYLEIAKLVGANQILEKPFSAETLRTIIAELLV